MKKKSKEEKAKLYGCDGQCYWNTGMCPCVETCPETRTKEGLATIAASVVTILFMILVPVMLVAFAAGLLAIGYIVFSWVINLFGGIL